ncbi:hypothetical protein MPSEU_000618400 [Mayamaea pseudoterrestris]|nr:hypothetical protein MPSEU_000618400 [Mayamaea pseudoterrestris]
MRSTRNSTKSAKADDEEERALFGPSAGDKMIQKPVAVIDGTNDAIAYNDTVLETEIDASSNDTIHPTPSADWIAKRETTTERLRRLAKGKSVKNMLQMEDKNGASSRRKRNQTTDTEILITSRKRRKGLGVTIDLDVLGLVMQYVGHRELLTLALSCKTLRDKLTMTMVVKSAMVTGNKTQEERLRGLELILPKCTLYAPSPLRLLQLVNAKRCEFCNEPGNYYISLLHGLFCCEDCFEKRQAKALTVTWRGNRGRSRCNAAIWDKRLLCTVDTTSVEMTTYPFNCLAVVWSVTFLQQQRRGGEAIGPICTRRHMHQILKLVKQYPAQPVSKIVDFVLGYDTTSSARYKEFMEARVAAQELAKKAAIIRRERRQEAALKAAVNRQYKVEPLLFDLQAKLRVRTRDFILKHSVNEKGAVIFDCPFVDNLLRGFVRAPTKVTSKDINVAAVTINKKIKMLLDSNLLSFDFLANGSPYEVQLKIMLSKKFPDLASVVPKLTNAVLGMIEENKLFDASTSLAAFKYHTPEFGKEILGGLVNEINTDAIDADLVKLVGAYWVKCYKKHMQQPREAYTEASAKWIDMVVKAKAFLLWIEGTDHFSYDKYDFCCTSICTPSRLAQIENGNFMYLWRDLDYRYGLAQINNNVAANANGANANADDNPRDNADANVVN